MQVAMKQYKICVVLFALISLNNAAVRGEGGDKVACRINFEPTVGLLVCKTAIVDGEACADVINTEIQNLANLRDAPDPGVRAVRFHPQAINDLPCGANPAEVVCSGFLEEWVGEDRGEFKHTRDAIAHNAVPALI
ncbi:hypothetical protein ACROYT_G011575 [Oculina patagonica]